MISCIIPVFNEDQTIKPVVQAGLNVDSIKEVIVVDDGSTDSTAKILSSLHAPKLKIIPLNKNRGKAEAVMEGLAVSNGNWILLLDGDLVGLTSRDLEALLSPALSNKDTATFAFLGNAPGIARMMGINAISGQRVFPRQALNKLDIKKAKGFSLEVLLNDVFLSENYKIKVVNWPKVRHRRKYEKRGYWRGWLEDDWMTFKLLYDFGLPHLVHQYRELSRRAKQS